MGKPTRPRRPDRKTIEFCVRDLVKALRDPTVYRVSFRIRDDGSVAGNFCQRPLPGHVLPKGLSDG